MSGQRVCAWARRHLLADAALSGRRRRRAERAPLRRAARRDGRLHPGLCGRRDGAESRGCDSRVRSWSFRRYGFFHLPGSSGRGGRGAAFWKIGVYHVGRAVMAPLKRISMGAVSKPRVQRLFECRARAQYPVISPSSTIHRSCCISTCRAACWRTTALRSRLSQRCQGGLGSSAKRSAQLAERSRWRRWPSAACRRRPAPRGVQVGQAVDENGAYALCSSQVLQEIDCLLALSGAGDEQVFEMDSGAGDVVRIGAVVSCQ